MASFGDVARQRGIWRLLTRLQPCFLEAFIVSCMVNEPFRRQSTRRIGIINYVGINKMRTQLTIVIAAVLLASPFAGCNRSDPLDLQAVSGRVSLDSQPLDNGSIQFFPVDAAGLTSGAPIVSGIYTIPKAKGLPPGKYIVRISSADTSGDTAKSAFVTPGKELPPRREKVPPQYNSKSELNVEVKTGGGNSFDFELKARPAR